ncbi:MAG: helix-turn-helix transcriptional regulator [Thermoanaerobaculia bacterium]
MAADRWTFLTNYGHVLLCIAADPLVRLRDVATRVGITERAAQRIVADLVEAGYLAVTRQGRRNLYEVNDLLPLRHPIEAHHQVAALLSLIGPASAARKRGRTVARTRAR